MKKETILKTIFILIVGAILFTMPVNVFAEPTDLDEFWEDQGGLEDIGGGTTDKPTETPAPTPEPEPTPTPTPTPEESIPHAGVAEDTMMVVTIAGLVILATVAYRKLNEYQNI